MRVSLNWLRQYIQFKLSVRELADQLTMAGLEVESIDSPAEKYRGFVVGEVLETLRHPNASRLTVCRVNVGKEILQIVCGAPNVAAGQKVAVGLVGATVPRNQHNPSGAPFVLTNVKLRGEDSYGMICSMYELDLGEDKDGIMILEPSARPGCPLAEYLGKNDSIFEIGITPNRSDAMSHFGVAREVGALVGKRLNLPKFKLVEGKASAAKYATVRLENKEGCPRYTARIVLNVLIAPSPAWMQDRLNAVGIRPVNNIVDVTNYVLMETGQPLHAFDYDKISHHSIIVRNATAGEKFTTLDHKERTLNAETLMICDDAKSLAIAGVMGGQYSEIGPGTKNVLIESAYFRPQSIRRTSKYLGLSTDASQRFERGADINMTSWAADRAAALVREISGGQILRDRLDAYPRKVTPRKITLRPSKVNEVLGTTLSAVRISTLLNKLEIEKQPSGKKNKARGELLFSIPSFRNDLEREIDLIEEVARTHGYNNIDTLTRADVDLSKNPAAVDFSDLVRQHLIGSGYQEIVCNSMQEKSIASITSSQYVEISNPISGDMSSLRTSMVPGMLQVIRNNIYHGNKDLRLFEVGRVYFHQPERNSGEILSEYTEEERVIFSISGNRYPASWDKKGVNCDMFDIKGEVTSLFSKIFLDKYKFIPYSNSNALTEVRLDIEINGVAAGTVGKIHQQLLKRFEIDADVFIAEIKLASLKAGEKSRVKFRALPKYPSVMRDLAFTVDKGIPVERIEHEILVSGGPLLSRLELFDIYAGDQIASDKKSVAFALEFMSEDHTMTQEEVDRLINEIIRNGSAKLGAVLRG